jgi:aminopeptidase N
MSSVSPDWPPPDPRYFFKQHQPSRAAYVFAIILPVILVALLAAPLGIVLAVRSTSPAESGTGTSGSPTDGSSGVGDPYFPDAGSGGYDVLKYEVSIDWDPARASMKATTKITARATQFLESFYVDLALQTERVQVDGQEATFEKQDFQDVQVTPDDPVPAESDFVVVVDYTGEPGALVRGEVKPWFTTGREWTVVGEPESAAWWFPSNDHPSDPALMDISVRVPADLQVISIGRLESKDTGAEADFDTWHWVSRQPLATYLAFIAIGQYQIEQGSVDGRPYVYAVSMQLSAEARKEALSQLRKTPATIRVLEQMFGPYPFTEMGGVVPAHRLAFGGIETQTRPVYNVRSILNNDFAPVLITHELAHMWFGDNVTLRQWDDIFNNEGYASWAQWGFAERTGGRPANASLNLAYDRTKDNARFWQVTMIDPGPDQLFGTVYTRGPMALQALRNVIGDDAFFQLARDWSQHPGTRSVEEWMAAAQFRTAVDLQPFFEAWIFGSEAPARTAENGFRD